MVFMVLTQSCDLVTGRKVEPCKSPYVNIAVIRSIDDQLPWLLSRVCKPVEAGGTRIDSVYRQEDKVSRSTASRKDSEPE